MHKPDGHVASRTGEGREQESRTADGGRKESDRSGRLGNDDEGGWTPERIEHYRLVLGYSFQRIADLMMGGKCR